MGACAWHQHRAQVLQPGPGAGVFVCCAVWLCMCMCTCMCMCRVGTNCAFPSLSTHRGLPPSRLLQENFDTLKVTLAKEDVDALSALNINLRFNDPVNFWGIDIHASGH